VALFVVWHERRPKAWALVLLCFLLPCVYWYARNALMTGDPFNPIGARVFGFTDWIPADYVQQLADVRDHAARPNVLIWPVVLVPFSALWKRSAAVRAAGWFCLYSIVVWVADLALSALSHGLVPAARIDGGASAGRCCSAGWPAACAAYSAPRPDRLWPPAPQPLPGAPALASADWVAVLLLAVLAAVSVRQTAAKVAMISPTPEQREAFLRQHVPGYAVMDYLRRNATGRVYQIA
jgi:hypothetical protein